MNLIECTIQMKQQSRDHYLRLAEAVEADDLRRLFTLLAAAEDEHLRLLRSLAVSEAGAAGPDTLEAGVCVFRPTITTANLSETLEHDPDAFRHVVAEEEEAIELFDHLAEESADARMKRLCRLLADRERQHLQAITRIYEFVEEPRTYLEWGEFGIRQPL